MTKEYKSFLKTVGSGEGQRCNYPTRLDTYGCGCAHDCSYCYAKSLLDFRGLWNPDEPSVADIRKIERRLDKVEPGSVLRLGGMTDCLQPCEEQYGVTLQTLRLMKERGIHALIVTKSDMVAREEYMDAIGSDLAHVQISVTSTDGTNPFREKAPDYARRLTAAKALQDAGFDVQVRLSPYVAAFQDTRVLEKAGIRKAVIEFLRVNTWIDKWIPLDTSEYTLKEGNYRHLPLERKVGVVSYLPFDRVTVCEDVPEHYVYWKENVNPNADDCCDLRMGYEH